MSGAVSVAFLTVDEGSMSNIDDEKVFDRAVDLIVHQDQMLQNWTTRLVAIEGGLMFAVATLLQWRANTPSLSSQQRC